VIVAADTTAGVGQGHKSYENFDDDTAHLLNKTPSAYSVELPPRL
jgi:hypothetical protein